MKKGNHTDFMIAFVQDYLNGDNSRMEFDLDFDHYLIQHYPGMERENPAAAECFAFYLSEEGIDRSENLSDAEHKKLIRRQFKEFKDALNDGFF